MSMVGMLWLTSSHLRPHDARKPPGPPHIPDADSTSPARPMPLRVTGFPFESCIWLPLTWRAPSTVVWLNCIATTEVISMADRIMAKAARRVFVAFSSLSSSKNT